MCFISTVTILFLIFLFFHMEEVVLVRFLNLASLPFFMCLQACYIVNLHSKNIKGEGTFCHSNIANSSASEGATPLRLPSGASPLHPDWGPTGPQTPRFSVLFFS